MTGKREERYPNEDAIRNRVWELCEQGQVKVLKSLVLSPEARVDGIVDAMQDELRAFLRVVPSPSAAINNMHAANLGRDVVIGVLFRIEWIEATSLLAARPQLVSQPGWADYARMDEPRHPEGSGRNAFAGAMYHLGQLAHSELSGRGDLPDALSLEVFDRFADHQDGRKRLTEREQLLMGVAIAREGVDYRNGPRTGTNEHGRTSAANSELMSRLVHDGFHEQGENVRILVEALLQPLARDHAGKAKSWADVQRAAVANWGHLALPIGTTREVLYRMFGRLPRKFAPDVELEVDVGLQGIRFGWNGVTKEDLASNRGLCPVFMPLRGAPLPKAETRQAMIDGGVKVRDAMATGRFLLWAAVHYMPMLAPDFPALSHLNGTPTLTDSSAPTPEVGIKTGR